MSQHALLVDEVMLAKNLAALLSRAATTNPLTQSLILPISRKIVLLRLRPSLKEKLCRLTIM